MYLLDSVEWFVWASGYQGEVSTPNGMGPFLSSFSIYTSRVLVCYHGITNVCCRVAALVCVRAAESLVHTNTNTIFTKPRIRVNTVWKEWVEKSDDQTGTAKQSKEHSIPTHTQDISITLFLFSLPRIVADGSILLKLQAEVAEPLPWVQPRCLPSVRSSLHHGGKLVVTYFPILRNPNTMSDLVVRIDPAN